MFDPNIIFDIFMYEILNNDTCKFTKEPVAVNVIYKVLTPQEWQAFQKDGYFRGSQLDQEDEC